MVTRRYFLRLLAGLPLLSTLPFFPPGVRAEDGERPHVSTKMTIGETFAGEELQYDIAFWFLKKVAAAKMTFTRGPEKGQYVSTLQGETIGLAGFVTRNRRDTYRAVMEEMEGGRRLRSLSFEEKVRVGNTSRQNTHIFNHKDRKWIEHSVRKSGAVRKRERHIPAGQDYNDFLTASYNFRYGVYGAVDRDRTYRVPVFPKKGVTYYDVKITSKAEEDRLRERSAPGVGSEYHMELAMDPEVLQSKKGLIKGWLTTDLYPVEGIIEDVLLFGDVRGTLLKRTKQQR